MPTLTADEKIAELAECDTLTPEDIAALEYERANPPDCDECRDTGLIDDGYGAFLCDCPAGETRLYHTRTGMYAVPETMIDPTIPDALDGTIQDIP